MKSTPRIFLFLLLSTILILFFYFYSLNREKKTEEYFENFTLNFSGTVYEKDSLEKNGGILRLNIAQSSIDSYDVRKNKDIYFCVVKDKKAELLVIFIDRFKIGDSVVVDGEKRTLFIYTKGKMKEEFELKKLIINNGPLHTTVKWHHKL